MNPPVCPEHGTPMKPSQYGGFFCASRNADNSYCRHKIKGGQAKAPLTETQPQPTAVPTATGPMMFVPGSPPNYEALACASLEFANRCHQGLESSPATVLAFAQQTFAAMKAML